MIKEQLKSFLTSSMKEGNKISVNTARMILAKIKDKELELGLLKEGKNLEDKDILQVLQQMIKQRKQSYEEYVKAERKDLADKELLETEIIYKFMPKQIDGKELEDIIQKAISDTKAISVKDLGKVMAYLKDKYSGSIDISSVASIIKTKL